MFQCVKAGCRVPVISSGPFPPLILLTILLWQISISPVTINAKGADSLKDSFQGIVELTEENFEEHVLDSTDPWIVLFVDGRVGSEWIDWAKSQPGVVGFGVVQRMQEKDLLDDIDYDTEKNPPARVYPYGGSKQKKKWVDVQSPKGAYNIAINGLPDVTKEISLQDLNDLLYESHITTPPSFPAIFITEKELPPVLKSIALHYNRYFNFVTLRNPDPSDLVTLMYDQPIPGFLVLVSGDQSTDGRAGQDGDNNFNSIGYTPERQGALHYPNIVKFLYSINIQYRHTLPGNNQAHDADVLRMDDVIEVEGQRLDAKFMNELPGIKGLEMFSMRKKDKNLKRNGKNEL